MNGVLMASQVAAGEENALKIRIYGEKGGIEWAQQEPNSLIVKWLDQPTQIFRAGNNYPGILSKIALITAELRAAILKVIWKHLQIFIEILH